MDTKKLFQLVALDLDGTLLNSDGCVSEENKAAIKKATQQGIVFAIATGRPYCGLPLEVMEELGIQYAITANGAAIYQAPEKNCLFEHCMPASLVSSILEKLLKLEIHMDIFTHGDAYTPAKCRETLRNIHSLPSSLKHYILTTREVVPDIVAFLQKGQPPIQKLTLNFQKKEDGSYIDREETIQTLNQYPKVTYLSGGYGNLEFTKNGVTKAKGLSLLCNYLGIPIEQSIACGDSENDLDIIKAAGLGVAMANAPKDICSQADDVTLSNDMHGVAAMLEKHLQ
ncbi:MAG: HAD family phosphatase [Lachnospiraceae bacterium]|jgi:Cof subfamily protein (haloacid dehalogenase superfamily)|nr:HAD family phosphatase [Lachnospiraceae bacterium]